MSANIPFVPAEEDDETTATDADGDAPEENERDVLIKAAEAALQGKSLDDKEEPKAKKEGEPERDEQGRFLKPPKVKEAPKDEKPSSSIARELAKREARREEETAYKSKMAEADQVLARAREAVSTLQRREADVARREKEVDELATAAQRDPMALMKRMGWSAEDFINNAERARDPNYQEALKIRGDMAAKDQVIARLTERLDRLDEVEKNYKTQGEQQQAQAEVQGFWSSLPEDSPIWTDDRYEDEDDILSHAKKVRQQFFNKTGKVASPQQLGEYLHYRALQRKSGVPVEPAGRKPGQAGQTKAKVSRALGSSDASERRSGNGKHVHDMTPEEEREYLMDVANNAVANSAD